MGTRNGVILLQWRYEKQ